MKQHLIVHHAAPCPATTLQEALSHQNSSPRSIATGNRNAVSPQPTNEGSPASRPPDSLRP